MFVLKLCREITVIRGLSLPLMELFPCTGMKDNFFNPFVPCLTFSFCFVFSVVLLRKPSLIFTVSYQF